MDNKGFIEIKITGKKGEISLSPETYDIYEIKILFDHLENLLFPQDGKGRPTISYEIKDGSVRHFFKTSMQAVISFNAVLGALQKNQTLDFLEYQTAKAIWSLQQTSRKQNYNFDISTSIKESNHLVINPETEFYLPENEWVDAEFYFYGEITNMGGRKIRMST